MSNVQIFTIGHSNRSLEEFLALLRAYGIRCLVDVRRFPTHAGIHSSIGNSLPSSCQSTA
ncbi:DUF488 family protein [Thermomicrobium sp. CFH 73360]|uniref:DUF488 family protein n=1 Tax=Thermomicrobium sp. CFH 73360 TaxID=2951987 RepID=UPI00336C12D2